MTRLAGTQVAFLGLGVMGAPMAGHVSAHGAQVTVWNRTGAKAEAWRAAHDGVAAPSIGQACDGARVVLACVGDDPDAQEVAQAAFVAMATGGVYVDHTTTSARLARGLAHEAKERGLAYLDAPVSGGEAGARAGQLSVMCGGDAAALALAQPVLDAYAKSVTHIGDSGAGQLAKAVNQICIAGLLQGLAEGVAFAQAAGLDTDAVFAAVSGGAAQSWQMDNRAATMAQGDFDFGFAVDWMRKDLRIALEEARAAGAQTPVTALVDQFYADVQAMGGGRWDTSSLVARLRRGA